MKQKEDKSTVDMFDAAFEVLETAFLPENVEETMEIFKNAPDTGGCMVSEFIDLLDESVEGFLPYNNITRIEIIGKDGREVVDYTENPVKLCLQDNGRTLKIFKEDK